MGDVMKPAEVAKALGISRVAVYGMIKRHEIPAVQIGGRLKVPRAAYEAWLARKAAAALNQVNTPPDAITVTADE